ncbi:MAG: Tn3 family transposase [Burkholderiales bacterium]|nr:Tn3 family transposase [Burkholderiales bacterium]
MQLPYRLRFVGAERLPRSLSDADVEEYFSLSSEDIAMLRERFAKEKRIGAALQYLMLRETGRPLDQTSSLPRSLLRSLHEPLGASEITLASLRALYKRRSTLFEHQQWARERAGFHDPLGEALSSLNQALSDWARGAASIDELVKSAERWLFERKCLIPSDRQLRDYARVAFADTERTAIEAVKRELSGITIEKLLSAIYVKHAKLSDTTVFEWLKTPSSKHGPSSLNELLSKIQFLKSLGAHTWLFAGMSNACLRAYAQQCASRPAFLLKRLAKETQTLEVVCFLRATLLDLTDAALYMSGRRISDLYRQASSRVIAAEVKNARELRERERAVCDIVHADNQTAEQKIDALKQLFPEAKSSYALTHAAAVRRALAADSVRVSNLFGGIQTFELQGERNHPVFAQIEALRTLEASSAKQLPVGFDPSIADRAWQQLLIDDDRVLALGALRAATLTSVRKGLRAGRLWIDHSWDYRNREALLIPPAEWKVQRSHLVSALQLTLDPKKFLQRLHAHLDTGLQALSEAVHAGHVEIDEKGRIRLQALAPRDIEPGVTRTREAMFRIIGRKQFSDMIVEIDAQVGFSEMLLGHRAKSPKELIACYGALLAHGTENDAKGVSAMVPGIEPAHISTAMRDLETYGRLRRANEGVVAFQRRHTIAALWGNGERASADMMALDASRHLFNARTDPRRRTFAVGLYTHILDAYGVIYDQPIVLNERQAAAAVGGIEQFNMNNDDAVRVSLLAVDTHGYTYPAMSIAKLLGFDLCPRLSHLSERRLFVPRGTALPENLASIVASPVSLDAIIAGWDELLRLVASIRSGRLTAKQALERLGSAAHGGGVHRAAKSLGQLLRTLFLCDYFSNDDFRREITTLLNRGESVHQLQRAIYLGKVAHDRGRRAVEMRTISGSHALLTNIVIAWNTMQMQAVVDCWKQDKVRVDDHWLRRMGPVHFGHVNFRGTMSFAVEHYAEALLERPATSRRVVSIRS